MHIALGAYLISGTPGFRQAGVHGYAKNLLHALAQDATHRPPIHYTAFVSPTAYNEVANLQPRIAIRTAARNTEKPLQRMAVEQLETPRLLRQIHADLYHGLLNVLPLRPPKSCKTVVSVMDLSFITQPHTHKLLNRTYLQLFARAACKQADHVIAISEHTKRDLVRYFGVSPHKISVTPLGVSADIRRLSDDAIKQFRAQQNMGEHAIFYLGSIEPRKNLSRLIQAFANICARSSVRNMQLFIGGSLGWKYDETLALVQTLGLGEHIKLLGRVAETDLPKWYSSCAVFCYPSLYEGFGLPVLEAMACGAAVVCSNVTALPEVVGDAGILVEPTDTDALATALEQVLSQPQLQRDLRQKATQRAKTFTWARTAAATVDVYERMLAHAR